MVWLFRELFFVRMAEVEKLKHALKKFIDIGLRGLVRRKEFVQVKVRKPAIGHTRRKKLPQSA
jgi:hypothetical protein